MIKYNIYPTLLDTFYWYKIKGDLDELLNKINRVPVEYPDSVKKGMELEKVVNALLDGEQLPTDFDTDLITRIATKLKNHTDKQQYIQGFIKTPVGQVKLYGFVDYVYPTRYVDLKTCGKYKKDKYKDYNQHGCYPLISKHITEFNYLVTDFCDMYIETYIPTKEIKEKAIYNITEFCEWLEANRHLITDKKIFNLK